MPALVKRHEGMLKSRQWLDLQRVQVNIVFSLTGGECEYNY